MRRPFSTAERTLHAARVFTESVNPRPELEYDHPITDIHDAVLLGALDDHAPSDVGSEAEPAWHPLSLCCQQVFSTYR